MGEGASNAGERDRQGEEQDGEMARRRYLEAAEEFFALARTAATPLMRAYYESVALRYFSSAGELKRANETAV